MTPEELFLTLLDRSLAAVWLVLAILLLRPFLKKVSRTFCCAMWGLVAIRLLCPVSIRSVLSLIPNARPIPTELAAQPAATDGSVGAGVQAVPGNIPSFLPAATVQETISPMQMFVRVAAVLWIVGMALIVLYALASYLRLRALTREAVKHPDGYWLCDRIQTPFILGLFRPRILLPLTMDAGDVPYVLAHERAHLARRDHWRKPIAFALLTVFWFQPVLWVAYFLLRRDVEFACDERAIRKLGVDLESRKCYAKALLRGSSPRAYVAKLTCPLAFGGLQVKRRVKSVMTYKRPALTLLLAALLVCTAVAVCFLTDPVSSAIAMPPDGSNENTGMTGAASVETPVVSAGGTAAKRPTTVKQEFPPAEEISYEDWMALRDPSLGISEDEWLLCYVLSYVRVEWAEDAAGKTPVEIYTNVGTEDITLNIYWEYGVYTPITDWEAYWATFDPDVTDPHEIIGAEIVTVEVPAGESVYVPVNAEMWQRKDIARSGYIGGSYGDISVYIGWNYSAGGADGDSSVK